MPRAWSRSVAGLVAVAGAAAVLAGCSGGGDGGAAAPTSPAAAGVPSTAEPTPSTTTLAASTTGAVTTVAPAGACSSSMLALATREGLGALGHALYVLQLRNTSAVACRMNGYPAVTLVGGDGRVLAEAKREAGYILPDRPPSAVNVAPGGSAYFGVESTNVCNGDARPAVSRTVRVVPPGATGTLEVAAEMNVCPGQSVLVSPVRPTERDITP